MRHRSRIALAALTAALALAVATAPASANRIEFNDGGFLFKWEAANRLLFNAFGFSAQCEFRMKGVFHSRTITKSEGALIGRVTESRIRQSCAINRAFILNALAGEGSPTSLPWHLKYRSFTGRLPTIGTITFEVVGLSILVETALEMCLYRTTNEEPFTFIATVEVGGNITAIRADETETIVVTEGPEEFCQPLTPFGTGREITTLTSKEIPLRVRLV
jgi:hypothetical protein